MSKLPTAPPEEVERASRQIGEALRANFQWYDHYIPGMKTTVVNTNVGLFSYFGVRRPQVIGSLGEVQITDQRPAAVMLICASAVPTSTQKVLLLEAILIKVAKLLGAPGNTNVDRYDPTLHGGTDTGMELGRVAAEHERRLIDPGEGDPYKSIGEPYSASMLWPPTPEA